MFSWNFAKSAEELLSRYAVKRICKFILKKKLGNFIHGDIDLDQLDVQLSSGLIVLTDLALNVDFLNHRLEQVSMFKVKEGSIRSLVVRMPWNGEGCEVEMDELELVVFPCCDGNSNEVGRSHDSNEDYCANHDLGKGEHDTIYKSAAVSVNIHEGVKTVAKMVKWLLTSFCIRIKRVIVAFDIWPEEKGKEGPHDALVLRVAELECEACISEGCSSTDDANDEDFLGISHLTSSLKFKGVVIELLHMNSVDNETCSTPQVAAFSCFLPNASRPLLTGEKGGFCGTVKLSIPWKNGSLDTCKVDAEVNVDTLIAKLQPSTLKWILVTWELLENYEKIRVDNVTHLSADSNLHASASLASSSCMMADKGPPPDHESFDLKMPMREEFVSDLLLKESCFISDWVPFSAGNCKNEAIEEANLGASVDQYFECFDELRSSQFILGSSGMWNLTCSVFSAITAASNLASESLNASTEQQHLETNLKMNFLGFSTIIYFFDEDQLTQHKPADEQIDPSFDVRHLCLSLQDIFIDVQVYPHEWKSKATVMHIVLDDYFCQKGGSVDFSLHANEKGFSGQTIMIRALQDKVLGVLPSSCMFSEPARLDVSEIGSASLNLLGTQKSASDSNLVKATLFETSNASHCVCAVSSRCFDGMSSRRISFSLNLPPVILWLNFDLVNVALELSRNLVSSSKMDKSGVSEIIGEGHTSLPNITSKPGKGSLRGSAFLPHARIVLCFPLKLGAGFRSYISCDQFIALDFSSPSNFEKLKGEGSTTVLEDNSWKKYSPSPSHSVHLNIVNLDVYHITRVVPDDSRWSTRLESYKFSSHRILSLGNGTCWVVLVSMLWHENAVTGDWVMKGAKNLATSEGPASNRSSATSDFEFASVSTREDKRVSSLPKQKELILSSKFCLHVGLPIMVVTLCRSQYLCFFNLLSQVIDALGSVGSDMAYENRGTIVAQSSVILECELAEIHIELDPEDCPKSSLQRELPGSWSRLRLEINNFQLLSVSDVGAISGARFLWISHDEGNLWGSITSVADQDLLLISCCNSSNGRGDGKSSNVLSCRHAGFDFVHVSDLESFHNYMSIVLKCITIVAPGGRLDWLDKIISFFSLPSPDAVQEVDCNIQKGVSERLSFVVSFIDGALSYEPYFCDLEVTGQCITPKSSISVNLDEGDSCIACLLSASSLTLSSTMVAGILENYYNIRVRDVGLLLHEASDKEKVVGDYSADYLRELGYVKVAGEALLDAVLRINFENGIFWELSCSKSHVILSTCHDTTLGLMRLASQIQQLFAPDMEESLVHLQNRWNSLKQVHGEDDSKEVSETSSNSSPRTFQVQQLGTDSMVESGLVSLMDEISEDAFLFHGNSMSSFGRSELGTSEESDRGLYHEGHSFEYPSCENSVQDGHSTILQSSEIMESCSLSGLRFLSDLTINSHFPESNSLSRLENRGNVAVQRVNSGWYESTSLSILENYVPDQSGQLNSKQVLRGQQNYKEDNGSQKFKGRVLLNNIDVKWRLFAGSDWHDLGQVVEHPGKNCGRDETVCLELALSDMNIHYDIFPDGNLCVSRLCLSIQDVDLFDKSENAPWIPVLGYYSSKEWPRQSFSKSIKLDLEAVRPDPMTPLEEYRLRIAVLPILLHLHQTQLDFLISFFGGKCRPDDQSQDNVKDSVSSDVTFAKDNKSKDLADEALLPFFQKFDIWPIIVRVDYCPSRVDLAALSGGKYVELVNLVHWKGVELHLKHVQAAGVYGWKNVCEITIGEWLEDISQNQIHKLLQGLTAIRSFVAVGSGAAKLVCLPVKNYRKDHRLVKGLQRGTVAFLRSISIEALGLGVHLAAGAHEILLHAECILRHIQPSLPNPIKHQLKTNRGSDQPEDAQHGLRQAYESLSDGLGKTASALIHTPMKTYQRGGGAGSALVTAVRGAPAAAIAPASAAAQALRCALLGVKNSLDRKHKENL